MKKIHIDQQGSTMVELGLILPMLIFTALAVVQFGIYVYVNVAVTAATEAASRAGSLSGANRAQMARAEINRYLGPIINTNQVTVTPNPSNYGAPGQLVIYTVRYPMPSVFRIGYGADLRFNTATFVVMNES